jgi:Secretion system C-terminal sorting domain
VRLVSFNAVSNKCDIRLNWSSALEENFAYYQIETGRDGIHFTALSKINAKGSNSIYEAFFNSSENGKVYVRLKLTDRDGVSKYSEVIKVNVNCDMVQKISLYPNPAANYVNLKLDVAKGRYDIQVIDRAGKIVLEKMADVQAGGQTVEIRDLEKLAKGLYYIRVTGKSGMVLHNKLIIQ